MIHRSRPNGNWFTCDPQAQFRQEQINQFLIHYAITGERKFRSPAKEVNECIPELRASFKNKCLYCEASLAGVADDNKMLAWYRPPDSARKLGEEPVLGKDEPHYFWLHWTWENLHLICPECAKSKMTSIFQVVGERAPLGALGSALAAEHPLLLDPCDPATNPLAHLHFSEDGMVKPRNGSEPGHITITVLQLNRPELVSRRREAALSFNALIHECVGSILPRKRADIDTAIEQLIDACGSEQPFAGMKRWLVWEWMRKNDLEKLRRWARLSNQVSNWIPYVPIPNNKRVDIGIVIALNEEFVQLTGATEQFEQVNSDPRTGLSYFCFTKGAYRCVAVLLGEMGNVPAALGAERLLKTWDVSTIVAIGISGSLSKDLLAGDLLVATDVIDYLGAATISPRQRRILQIEPAPRSLPASQNLVNAINNLLVSASPSFAVWQRICEESLTYHLKDAYNRLLGEQLIRLTPQVQLGPLASGPFVVTDPDFKRWIGNRKIAAVDMESWGVMKAAQNRGNPVNTVVIRGISDFADDRKTIFDSIGEGAIRRYAMGNALAFLWCLLDAELLTRSNP
jgi:nucleoside phosphorylase